MTVERIAVVGAGTMGQGIAQVAAQSGYRTVLCDTDAAILDRAMALCRQSLDRGIEKGKITPEIRAAALTHLATSLDLRAAAADADLVIEAVPESMEIKRSVFATIEKAMPAAGILATNTSSLSIAALAEGLQRPGRFLGLHFFNPVPIMPLLEIVVHRGTSDATLVEARAVSARLGKTCIVVRDAPGFASSRLGVALGLEAMRMLEQGVASAEDIDAAMELGYRHPMGPLRLSDLVGLDVRLGIAESLFRQLGTETFRPPQILIDLVRQGRTGKKSGHGFYDW
jgi:3-hydroxybutyryl-CoA dehydrogenase